MSALQWQIPPSLLQQLQRTPKDRAVVMLVRHSVREALPPGDVGNAVPITDAGRGLALELGRLLRGRLRTLETSPVLRCVQTAQAIAEGAGEDLTIRENRLLGEPGAFVLDGGRAWANWERLGHEGVVQALVSETSALPGMARPDEAARFLVRSMLTAAADQPGLHLFVTHDLLVTATAARLLGRPLGLDEWPWFLEAACFWSASDGVEVRYRDHQATHPDPLCGLAEADVLEFARREIAATVGFSSGARFFLAGGAFKSLLTGRPPKDLDLWAPSEDDRALLIAALQSRGARPAGHRPFADAFEVGGRVVEVPHATDAGSLPETLARFDIGLSAVGVEHRPNDGWSVMVHTMAHESVLRREVLLLKPLVNWKYALTTLERTRRYAQELSFSVPPAEEAEVWRVFEAQDAQLRAGLIERYRRTGLGGFGIMEDIACRYP
ncbi:MAG: histidine phosphatase family protein [Myxococcales bacterium]|nr:histidine phosphatase family protein [Myxococcales bacterium]